MAESFGSDVERYDRTRPRYPPALVDRIVAESAGTDLLDVGCGTGIEARAFQAAGCTVLGVEPDARMARFAGRSGVNVEVSTFEAWVPAGRTFDAVIAGTAWHWVDPVAGAAKAARVLRPGGRLAPFWHVFQLPSEVALAFTAVYRRVAPESQAGGFGDVAQWRFDWERAYTRDDWLDGCRRRAPSRGLRRTRWRTCWRVSEPRSMRSAGASRCPTPPSQSPRRGSAPPSRLRRPPESESAARRREDVDHP